MMRYIIPVALIMYVTTASMAPDVFAADEQLTASELVRRVETQYNGDTSYSVATMQVVTDAYAREMTLEMWSEGRDKFLAVIREPVKEAGTASMKIDDDMWNYLPKIDRLMKIPSSMMGSNWMGSHFTNDDLVKENKIEELYDLGIEDQSGGEVTIVGIPKPDAAVVWGKISYRIDIERLIPIHILYYDEDGELVRTMTFTEVQQVDDRWLPLKMIIQPEDKPDEQTVMTYTEIEFDIDLGNNRFSIQSLRRQ